MLRLCPLSEQNYLSVAQIDHECLGAEGWSEKLYFDEIADPDKHYFVAYKDESVVGFGGFAHILDEGHIMNIAVTPAARRQGVASEILTAMLQCGKEMGVTAFTLEVRASNVAAIALYEKRGFVLSGVRKKYYGDEDARIYWLYL